MGHHSNKEYAAKVAALEKPKETWPKWIVTGGGVGFLRPAPGSWGTIPPAALYWVLLMAGVGEFTRTLVMLVFALVAAVLLVRWGRWACAYFQQIDPGSVILDEYVGFSVAVAFVPMENLAGIGTDPWRTWLVTAAAYVLFRATDTLKIPPARQLEALPWGWGILLDDVAAGIQANIIGQILVRVIHP